MTNNTYQKRAGQGTGEVKWYYAIDHMARYSTRHEAVGDAAIINRERDPWRDRMVTVWAYPECDCSRPITTFDVGNACGRCGAEIP